MPPRITTNSLSQASYICRPCLQRLSSTTSSPSPPLLLKLRNDLKTAMRAKDTNRLNVLRGILADVTNASKTSNPVSNDLQLLSILRKRAAASKAAAQEFGDDGRADLKDKEDAQVEVLESYAGDVKTMSDDEIRSTVDSVVKSLRDAATDGKKVGKGDVLKKLLGPEGAFQGKPVEKSQVAKAVDAALA